MANPLRHVLAVIAAIAATVLVAPTAAHADQIRDNQWHLTYLKATQLHAITKGEGITVAVIDSGVNGNHPDLKGNVLPGKDTTPNTNPAPWNDTDGHGTAMASLIAAHGHGTNNNDGTLGIAPGAKILPIKVPKEFGDNLLYSDAIRWAVESGAKVISLSVGSDIDDPGEQEAINYALSRNVVVVAGVGNTTQGHDRVIAPARYPGVIAVSGLNMSGKFASQSVQGPEVVVSAPAVNIQAAGAGKRGQYGVATGTSDATAIVSGIVALIRAKYPDLDAANVINRLITTANDEGAKGRDPKYGYGVVNPLEALTKDVPAVDRNPLLPKPTDTPTDNALPGTSDNTPTGAIIAFTGAAAALLVLTLSVLLLIRHNRRTKQTQQQPWPTHPPPPPH